MGKAVKKCELCHHAAVPTERFCREHKEEMIQRMMEADYFGKAEQPAKLLLTEQEAAQIAGVSRKTIRRLIEQGRLEASDYGTAGQHNYRIRPDALANLGMNAAPAPAKEPPQAAMPAAEITPPVPALRPRERSRRQSAPQTAAAYLPRVSA